MRYSGRVHNIIYEDASQAFYILKVELDDSLEFEDALRTASHNPTVKGHIPGLAVSIGCWFAFEAKWVQDGKFGPQLHITKAPILLGAWNADTAAKTLISMGLDKMIVSHVQKHSGDDFIPTLEDPDKLRDIPGISQLAAQHIHEKWLSTQTYFRTLDFLADLSLPHGIVRQIWSQFGDETQQILTENPWALCRVDGIKFQQADEIAQKLRLSLDSPYRIEGAVLYSLRTHKSMGHVFLTAAQLAPSVSGLIGGASISQIGEALVALHRLKLLVLDRKTKPRTMAIYDPWDYRVEVSAAQRLINRQASASWESCDVEKYKAALIAISPNKILDGPIESVVKQSIEVWAEQAHLQLSDTQKEGVANALLHPVSVLTGLPGTGKTTSLRAAVRILQEAGIPILLCAPTGIAAKRLSSVTGAPASTIHRALGAQGFSTRGQQTSYAGVEQTSESDVDKGENTVWGCDDIAEVVIVDESSMVDQHLLFRLLRGTSKKCRVVFVGDDAQLPSVGSGNVLRDMIRSKAFPVVKLTEIFRQNESSGIVPAAHKIHAGILPDVSTRGDFIFLPVSSEEEAQSLIQKLCGKLFEGRKEFQVLSPKHGGLVGVTALNKVLREQLNPMQAGLAEYKLGKDVIREGDRVMIVKNDYQLQIFNGDVGKVTRIDRGLKAVRVRIFGDPPMEVSITFTKARRLIRLAYACTVHKAQGLEYDHIIIPVMYSFSHQLQRNLYYTAITRAKKKVILVGHLNAFARAVTNAREGQRNTLLTERIQSGEVTDREGAGSQESSSGDDGTSIVHG